MINQVLVIKYYKKLSTNTRFSIFYVIFLKFILAFCFFTNVINSEHI